MIGGLTCKYSLSYTFKLFSRLVKKMVNVVALKLKGTEIFLLVMKSIIIEHVAWNKSSLLLKKPK